MKLTVEQDDIFQAVRAHFGRAGFDIPEDTTYQVRTDDTGGVVIDILGVTLRAPPPAAPPPPAARGRNPAPSPVEGGIAAVADEVRAERQAVDPGPPPPPDDGPSFADLARANAGLVDALPDPTRPNATGYTPPRDRYKTVRVFENFEDMGKDPTDFSDEI